MRRIFYWPCVKRFIQNQFIQNTGKHIQEKNTPMTWWQKLETDRQTEKDPVEKLLSHFDNSNWKILKK